MSESAPSRLYGCAQAGTANTAPSAAPSGVVPLFSPAAASRLFIGRVPLTEAGQAAATAAAAEPNPSMRCEPIGILQDWSYDSPVNRITQDEKTIKLEYGKFDYARTIHLDRSAHPENPEPSVTGHSIGRWENDVLIVDTIGFAPGVLSPPLLNSFTFSARPRASPPPTTPPSSRSLRPPSALPKQSQVQHRQSTSPQSPTTAVPPPPSS